MRYSKIMNNGIKLMLYDEIMGKSNWTMVKTRIEYTWESVDYAWAVNHRSYIHTYTIDGEI